MKFCKNCGSEMKEKDNFCTSCGEKSEQSEQAKEFSETSEDNSQKKLVKIFGNMIFRPVKGIKDFVKNASKKQTIIFSLILIVMQGIIGIWKGNRIFNTIEDLAIRFIRAVAAIMNTLDPMNYEVLDSRGELFLRQQISGVKENVHMPYLSIFLQNIIMLVVIIFVLFICLLICLLICNSIFGNGRNKSGIVYRISVASVVPMMSFEVISVLFSYITTTLQFSIIIIGSIVTICCFAITLREQLKLSDGKCMHVIVICVMMTSFVAIVLSIFCAILSAQNITDGLNIMEGLENF